MTLEQFNALVQMIRVIVCAEITPTHLNVKYQNNDIAEARKLLVEDEPLEITSFSDPRLQK